MKLLLGSLGETNCNVGAVGEAVDVADADPGPAQLEGERVAVGADRFAGDDGPVVAGHPRAERQIVGCIGGGGGGGSKGCGSDCEKHAHADLFLIDETVNESYRIR